MWGFSTELYFRYRLNNNDINRKEILSLRETCYRHIKVANLQRSISLQLFGELFSISQKGRVRYSLIFCMQKLFLSFFLGMYLLKLNFKYDDKFFGFFSPPFLFSLSAYFINSGLKSFLFSSFSCC